MNKYQTCDSYQDLGVAMVDKLLDNKGSISHNQAEK